MVENNDVADAKDILQFLTNGKLYSTNIDPTIKKIWNQTYRLKYLFELTSRLSTTIF